MDLFSSLTPENSYAEVAIKAPLNKTFHYYVPEEMRDDLKPGARVRIPFGPRKLVGYCINVSNECPIPDGKLKPVIEIIDAPPLLNSRMLELARWISDEYVCSLGMTLEAMLPTIIRKGTAARQIVMVEAAQPPEELRAEADKISKRAPKQADALRTIAHAGTELACNEIAGATTATLRALEKKGLLRVWKEELPIDALAGLHAPKEEPLAPTADQKAALDEIFLRMKSREPGVALLHGVTGSGKTEVYLQALNKTVDEGRQGIVLVPEISLTPQTVRRFAARFERVAVMHSRLTEAERREQWRRVNTGEIDVIVGTRSAIFAPTQNLGLVVIDEEFDQSFKHIATPRYNAVNVAIQRAKRDGALVILGSATPSLETYYKALNGEYGYLKLPARVHQTRLPQVDIIDMKQERDEQKKYVMLSKRLIQMMKRALSRGEQVMLFLNRRGFSTFVMCTRCKHLLTCERCALAMVYHRNAKIVKCHHCGRSAKPPAICPACNVGAMRYMGTGIQRIEEIIGDFFPEKKFARMDSDATRGRHSHREILDDFRAGRIQILLGTQMIAKGLDFPTVTLVGVLDADVAMHLPDFRASEKTFQLLTQVAGRTGRGDEKGRVVIQTSFPEQAFIQFAKEHDYEAFAERELQHRRALGYPPFGRLARVIVESDDPDKCASICNDIAEMLNQVAGKRGVQILGPTEAPYSRVRGRMRRHIIIKEKTPGDMHRILADCRPVFKPYTGATVTIDVDPMNML